MARMYPERFPPHKDVQIQLEAEKETYYALEKGLNDSCLVFYSASWQGPTSNKNIRDCEIDFLIAHPKKGMIIVEVKGGGIRYDATNDTFYTITRSGKEIKIQNPYEQAKNNKHLLLTKLKAQGYWGNLFVTLGHCVIFPMAKSSNQSFGLSNPKELTLFYDDMGKIEEKIESIFAYWLGDDQNKSKRDDVPVEGLRNLFSKSWKINIPLNYNISKVEKRIIELTEEQYTILDFLRFQKRALIKGAAGSGKTLLAIEKAKRLAADGFNVLILCFNKPLKEHIESQIKEHQEIKAYTFHGACIAFGLKTGVLIAPPSGNDAIFYNQILPELLMHATDKMEEKSINKYDAIIVDEGQDFHENWWIPLQCLLKEPDNGLLYIFYDDRQIVIKNDNSKFPIDMAPLSLSQNLRNTKKIFEFSRKILPELEAVNQKGPEGDNIEFIEVSNYNKDLHEKLRKLLHRLIDENSISINDLTILTGKTQKGSSLNGIASIGNRSISFGKKIDGMLHLESIRRFKGLENSVIILTELEDIMHDKETLYVGISRARAMLVIVDKRNIITKLKF